MSASAPNAPAVPIVKDHSVPQILHLEPSLDASGLRSDVISSTKIPSREDGHER